MNGLGGLNKSPNGVVIGLVQLQLPIVATPADLARADRSASSRMVGKARRNLPTMDLVVFPEYALHGLSMDTNPEIMCALDGPEVAAFKAGLHRQPHLGLLLHHGAATPAAIPTIPASSSTTQGELRLYYRKLHPWVPVEPWEPGDLGIPVIDGPKGCQARAHHLPRRHVPRDGARVRLQGRRDHAPHRRLHRADPRVLALHQPGQRLLQSDGDGQRLHVRLRRHLRFHGRGDDRQFRRHRSSRTARRGRPDEIITAEVRPDLVREARAGWGVENNIYQLGHRGYTAVAGGAGDCPYTYMQDLVAGRYRLPWEDAGAGDRRHELRLPRPDAPLCAKPSPTPRNEPYGARDDRLGSDARNRRRGPADRPLHRGRSLSLAL